MTERAYRSDGAAPKKPTEEGADQPALETVLVETETRADDGAQLGPPLPDSTEMLAWKRRLRKSSCARQPRMLHTLKDLIGSAWKRRLRKSLCARQPRMLHTLKMNLRLPRNFKVLSPRARFLERRSLFSQLFRFYKDQGLRRPDLAAMKQMKDDGSSYQFEDLGPVPGIEETDIFLYRSEVVVVGLHRQVQRGIAHVPYGGGRGERVACSMVVSGGYIDDVDQGDCIVYTGQGGSDRKGDKHQITNQTPDVANKALINSCRLKTPVRVIRAQLFKQFSFAGMFHVTGFKYEDGKDGHKVYKFTLQH